MRFVGLGVFGIAPRDPISNFLSGAPRKESKAGKESKSIPHVPRVPHAPPCHPPSLLILEKGKFGRHTCNCQPVKTPFMGRQVRSTQGTYFAVRQPQAVMFAGQARHNAIRNRNPQTVIGGKEGPPYEVLGGCSSEGGVQLPRLPPRSATYHPTCILDRDFRSFLVCPPCLPSLLREKLASSFLDILR